MKKLQKGVWLLAYRVNPEVKVYRFTVPAEQLPMIEAVEYCIEHNFPYHLYNPSREEISYNDIRDKNKIF